MKICQQGMIYRKMAHLPPLIVMTKQNIQYLTRKERYYIKFFFGKSHILIMIKHNT
jgi:hypothetical protein